MFLAISKFIADISDFTPEYLKNCSKMSTQLNVKKVKGEVKIGFTYKNKNIHMQNGS